jgi:hypothetical protein
MIKFGQASTWKGIITLIVGIGLISLTDVQVDTITTAMVSIYAALSVIFPDIFKTEVK